MREKHKSLIFAFPGDEEQFGGCLAAGRGFIHVNPEGKVEACPFAPYSDSSLEEANLEEALRSPLMKLIRENHHLLKEVEGGCALWSNKDWLESKMEEIASLN